VKVLVYGLGRSGGAVARLLCRQGHEVWTYDAAAPQGDDLTALGCRRTDTPLHTPAEVCVAAPGVPYDAPDLVALRARGLETVGEVEWVYRTVAAPIIGITGTAGKTTTTRWLSHVLTKAGLDAHAGGNVDPALAAVAEPGRVLVTELSSFQLERCPTLKPSVAVILNLGTDHLDRHGSVAAYHAAKGQLIANLTAAETFIYNHDDPVLRAWAEGSPARTWGFSAHDARAAAHLAGDTLVLHGEPFLRAAELQLSGRHHLLERPRGRAGGVGQGLGREAIRAGLTSFAGVPGRYSLVLERARVRFVDDSIATRTLAVQAALAATPRPSSGSSAGRTRGPSSARSSRSYASGCGAASASARRPRLYRAPGRLDGNLLYRHSGRERALLEAVTEAAELLRDGGGTVLLAPLAASFDQFSDYRERASAFRRAPWSRPNDWRPRGPSSASSAADPRRPRVVGVAAATRRVAGSPRARADRPGGHRLGRPGDAAAHRQTEPRLLRRGAGAARGSALFRRRPDGSVARRWLDLHFFVLQPSD
jgi:UDP-N-acetylmuramoylalanine--D-glutamate ligase